MLIADAKCVDVEGLEQTRRKETDIERHILGYLRYLQAGGHHVLFFPPEFDEDDLRTPVRFSLVAAAKYKPLESIDNITSTMINNYLSLLWFTCAFIAHTTGEAGNASWENTTSLAIFRSWSNATDYKFQWHFLVEFGQPRVDILCDREVILYFTFSEVTFFSSDEEKLPRESVISIPLTLTHSFTYWPTGSLTTKDGELLSS